MKRLLSLVAMVGLAGAGTLVAQQSPSSTQTPSSPSTTTPSTQTPSTTDQNSSMPNSSATSSTSSQSARSFQGKIEKSGDKLVLRDSATQTAYQLDDQDKAKQYQDQNVKVMATLDSTNNTLHVVDISPASNQ